MKHKIIMIISFILVLFNINNVNAKEIITATVNEKEGLYIREGAGTNYNYVKLLKDGETITLVADTKVKGEGCDGWYEVIYNGKQGYYICSEYVSVKKIQDNELYYTTSNFGTRINENYANVRKTPNGAIIDRIYLGTEVKVLSSSNGSSKVSYYNGKEGYVYTRLISTYDDLTAYDKDYEEVLKKQGFPSSYIPFLTYLHQKHPNWKFETVNINKKFNDVIDNEKNKNYIQTSEERYRANNKVKENPSWYTASTPIVAFLLDPRNYLTETNIFAFENLKYDETTQTKEVVKSIFSGTYLSNNEYVNYYIKYGKEYNISPVHLASRSIQEGMGKETYAAVSGTATSTGGLKYRNKNLDGYYNFFNIGAYQDDYTNSAVTRGVAVAAGYVGSYDGTPWDTREKAIKYGSKFIADGYVSKGQDTMYFQKFNTKDGAYYPSYTNQYMTNIIAPASEALDTFDAYSDMKYLDNAFTFLIPVYKNMPEEFTSHPPYGDTNNDLESIEVNGNKITGFDSDVINYEYFASKDTKEVTIKAVAKSTKALVTGDGKITLTDNETTVNIKVQSEVGNVKTYVIKIKKQDSSKEEENNKNVNDILKNVDVKINNDYMSGITKGTTASNLNDIIKKEEPDVKITIVDKDNKDVSGTLKTGDVIVIESKVDKKTYTISIKGDVSGDGKITIYDLLLTQKHILNKQSLNGAYNYAADVNNDGKITIYDLLLIQKYILGKASFK